MRLLRQVGAQVLVWDDAGEKSSEIPWADLQAIVASPGIPFAWPHPHSLIEKARWHGVPILSDVDVLRLLAPQATFLAITGTNGKSTTTAWLGHVLSRDTATPCQMGGNIGLPALDLPILTEGRYVLELSSYQLEISVFPLYEIALLLNLAPDHLTRHGGWEGYVTAKRRIFLNPQARAVVGVDDLSGARLVEEFKKDPHRVLLPISGKMVPVGGVGWKEGVLMDAYSSPQRPLKVLRQEEILQGEHNRQNAAAVYAMAMLCGRDAFSLAEDMRSFKGLEHRQEEVLTCKNVTFINDSKATNAGSVIPAFQRFPQVYWIAGGRPKEDGIASLAPYWGCIKKAFLIGEAAELFAQTLAASSVPFDLSHTLEAAVAAAFSAARQAAMQQGPQVVLFSPACASFDQFANFEERGACFKRLVQEATQRRA